MLATQISLENAKKIETHSEIKYSNSVALSGRTKYRPYWSSFVYDTREEKYAWKKRRSRITRG